MDSVAFLFAKNLAQSGLPLLAACVTILVLLSSRNSHLSDRSREIVDRRLKLESKLRNLDAKSDGSRNLPNDKDRSRIQASITNLNCQNEQFIRRYKATAWSLIFVTISFLCFVGSDFAASVASNASSGVGKAAETFGLIGIALFAWGIALLMREFAIGYRTLEKNSQ